MPLSSPVNARYDGVSWLRWVKEPRPLPVILRSSPPPVRIDFVPAVIGATLIFVLEFRKFSIAVEAPALSLAVTPSDAWWILVLSEGICGLPIFLPLLPLFVVGLERSSGFCVGLHSPKERPLEDCLTTVLAPLSVYMLVTLPLWYGFVFGWSCGDRMFICESYVPSSF